MKCYTFIIAISVTAPVVFGQDLIQNFQPFESPGVILPGLPVSFLINAAGGFWQQGRVIDSLDYACSYILTYLGSVIPDVDQTSLYWGHICDEIHTAANDLDAFDATTMCNSLTSMIIDLIATNNTNILVPGQANASQEALPFDALGMLMNISRDLYGIDLSDLSTICTNVKENFLKPSLQNLISQVGTEVLTALLPQAVPICQNWNAFLEGVGVNSSYPYYDIIQNAARIASQAVGYNSRQDLCQAMEQASASEQASRTISTTIIASSFTIPTNGTRCSMLANDAINDIINPILVLEEADGFHFNNGVILQYTGFPGVEAICNTVEIAFTSEVRLPAPVPFELIPGTTLTVEFFIDSVGGIWQQDRLIDSMAFICTKVLPDLESMVPGFSDFSQYYLPICQQVRVATTDLIGFDATGSCNGITTDITDLISQQPGLRRRRQVDPSMDDPLGIIGILENTTRDLYGININDPLTICPNVAQFLGTSLPELITQFGAEVISALLPQVSPLCRDLDGLLVSFGFNASSPFFQIIQDAARIASQLAGFNSREELCTSLDAALSVQGDNGDARRIFARNIIRSNLEIFTDTTRCVAIANDVIDDIIDAIFRVEGVPLMISNYTISRYTGLMGVDGVCRAMDTAFAKLSGSTVMITATVESHNGQPLVYMLDLANRDSARFKELQTLFCEGIENHLTRELPPSLRRIFCRIDEFRSGSVVADMQIEVQATTQEVADSLGQDVLNLDASGNLTLSANGETLSVSTLSVSEPSGSTVNITVTGEMLNGVTLDYTPELANVSSALFRERQTLFCEAMKTFTMNQLTGLASTLLRVNCAASSFRSGSLIADLVMELFAATQADADALAQALRNIVASTKNLNLTVGTDVLSISSVSLTGATPDDTTDETTEGGISTGALIGIILGVVSLVIVSFILCICCIMGQNIRLQQAELMMRAEQGKQNGAFYNDHVTKTPRYVYGVNAASDRSRDHHMYESTKEMERRSPYYNKYGPSHVSGSWKNEKRGIERNPHPYM